MLDDSESVNDSFAEVRHNRFPHTTRNFAPLQVTPQLSRGEMGELIEALRRLDNCMVPQPMPFDAASGALVDTFFTDFENYCCSRFAGSRDMWLPELRKFLEGDILDVYEAVRGPSDGYDGIKSKLCKWFKESRLKRQHDQVALFKSGNKKYDETLYVYAVRLE